MHWTEALIDIVEKQWTDGRSANEIARGLEKEGVHVSKNAIIGVVHRRRMKRRYPAAAPKFTEPKEKAPRAAKTATPRIVIARAQTVAAVPEPPEPAPVIRTVPAPARGNCKWPIGEPGADDFHYCGRETTDRLKPYCLEHGMKAVVPSKPINVKSINWHLSADGISRPRRFSGAPLQKDRRFAGFD